MSWPVQRPQLGLALGRLLTLKGELPLSVTGDISPVLTGADLLANPYSNFPRWGSRPGGTGAVVGKSSYVILRAGIGQLAELKRIVTQGMAGGNILIGYLSDTGVAALTTAVSTTASLIETRNGGSDSNQESFLGSQILSGGADAGVNINQFLTLTPAANTGMTVDLLDGEMCCYGGVLQTASPGVTRNIAFVCSVLNQAMNLSVTIREWPISAVS